MRRKTSFIIAISIILLVASAWLLSAENRVPGKTQVFAKEPRPEHPASTQVRSNKLVKLDKEIKLPGAPRAFGIIKYDTGAISAVATIPGRTFGNRFNTALNGAGTALAPVQVSGFVTVLQWVMWGTTTQPSWGTFWITVFGPLAGTSAPMITAVPLTGVGGAIPITVSHNFTAPVAYTGPSFLAGMRNSNSTASVPWNGPCPVFGSATTGGQGFHGMGINWGATTGTGFVPLASQNTLMRASGNVITPVELMRFTVE
ncbi:MAG: hypothetical protein GY856_20725 [bacterium]|nr:hypothetical protein [bacterium]